MNPKKIKTITKLKHWQKDIENLLNDESIPSIHWYYDKNGCVGKTAIAKYMCVHHNVPLCFEGNGKMMKKAVMHYFKKHKELPEMFIVDFTHQNIIMKDFYDGLEELNDGVISGPTKYGCPNVFNRFNIVILSKTLPDFEKISKWKVKVIHI